MSKVTTKHSDVVAWWYKKYINPDGSITDEAKPGGELVLVDRGEPSCWACNKQVIPPQDDSDCDWRKMWDNGYTTSHLERCHIQAESLGGKDEPSNLFLMCKRCHAESPDVKNTSAFFRWVYDKRQSYSLGVMNEKTLRQEINKELERRGLPDMEKLISNLPVEKQEGLNNLICNKDAVQSYTKGRVTSHWNNLNTNSLIIGIVDYLMHNYTTVVLD